MELRDALRMLRSELGLTQSEFAAAINVGYSAESRWENQNTRPNRASSAAILALAKQRCVSSVCLDALTSILLAPRVDDRQDKALAEEVTARMKLEQRELLTSEQLKSVIDNLDLAIIGHRICSGAPDNAVVFYHNKRFAEIFGYDDEAEFDKKSDENIYFSIPPESHAAYLKLLKKLLSGEITLPEYVITISGFRKNGDIIWLEIKGVALTQFSFGHELFISCRDVTARVEAERKYAEEIAVRDASLQGFFASLHCDLATNEVFRHRNAEKATGTAFAGETVDEVLDQLAKAALDGPDREAFRQKFTRLRLLDAYGRNDTFGSRRVFNTVVRRWMRVDYVLMKNPYSGHVEAAVYIYDIQDQAYAEKMVRIVANRFFEYIGLIDTKDASFVSYYYDADVFRQTVGGRRDYRKSYEEKLRLYGQPEAYDTERAAASMEAIHQHLETSRFYTIVLRLKDYDGNIRPKRITYTYLDETRTTIVMAQSDRENIEKTLKGSGADAPDDVGETRRSL